MLPEKLKRKIEAHLAAAAAQGDDALGQKIGGLTKTLNGRAQRTASAADAGLWFATARHVLEVALARLPKSWRLGFIAGSVLVAQSWRFSGRVAHLEVQPDNIEILVNLGVLLKSYGELEPDRAKRLEVYAEAERLYRRVLEIQPDYVNALGNLGLLLKNRGDLESGRAERLLAYCGAETSYRRVLELQSDDIATLSALGGLLSNRGALEPGSDASLADYTEAERLYRRILELQPDDIVILVKLGVLLQRRGELEPDRTQRLEVYAEAEGLYRHVLELHPHQPATLANLGVLLQRRGKLERDWAQRLKVYAEAEACYRRVLELQPDQLEPLVNLGALLWTRCELEPSRAHRLESYAEAERLYRHALELQPDQPDTLVNLGNLLKNRGDLESGRAARLAAYTDAERCYRRVLELHPDQLETLINLGGLLSNRGDVELARAQRLKAYDEAEGLYRRVLQLHPDQLETLSNLGVLLRARSELEPCRAQQLEAFAEAEGAYRRALELQPDKLETLANLGALLMTRGGLEPARAQRLEAYDEAEGLYWRVLELHPDQLETLVNLGALQHKRSRLAEGSECRRLLAEAAAFSARVLELQPTENNAMHNLMLARLDALRLEDGAAGWIERAREALELLERRRSFAAVTTDPHFRTELSSSAWPLGPFGAVCHIKAGDLPGAVVHLDANMAMSLAEALATPERRLIELERQGEAIAAHRFVLARDALAARIEERADLLQAPRGDTEEAEATRQAEIEALSQEIEAVEQERDIAIADIRAIPGFDDFLRPGGDIGLIRTAARERPLVYLAASPWGGHALLVHGEAIDDVPLDALTDAVVAERLKPWQERYQAIEAAAQAERVTRFAVVDGSSAAERQDRDQVRGALDEALAAFDGATRELCRWLGEVVMQPVLGALERHKVDRAVLLPSGQLTYLPLHAAIVGGSADRPTMALDRLHLSYAANARLARDSAARLHRQPPPGLPGLVAIVDPVYGDLGHRHVFGPDEVAMLVDLAAAGRLELTCHAGPNARVTLAATSEDGAFPIRDLARHQILHLGCHGRAEHVDVFNSRLQLAASPDGAGDQLVTIEVVLDHWPVDQLRLVVLSCCEGAMSGRQSFDELVSLQTAFAQGGAAAVVGAMWSVRDDHTAALMRHFYDALLVEPALDPAKALATAQALLLDTTPEAFPTIAAFQVLQG